MSTASPATEITYGGYTHDTSTDIVVGDGLEWLQWDRTVGMSWNDAKAQLDTIEGGGWQIASNTQMQSLFANFFSFAWDANENTTQDMYTGTEPGIEVGTDLTFVAMFGDTYAAGGLSYDYGEGGFEASLAYFGLDSDADSGVNFAFVYDDYTESSLSLIQPGRVVIARDLWGKTERFDDRGVALVRSTSGPAVPAPSVIALLGLGLAGMGVLRRRSSGA